ncbi:MAG: hypothetical protein DRQ46_10065 [Gammaproteobacteria bacterium]|nr:MAG: hypothetical protein DRQ46_10065 [Gammaproteobacteria bacterium]
MTKDIYTKNYDRDKPTFANINLLGTCNIDCYFCLGKDLPEHFKAAKENVHFSEWKNFDKFLLFCQDNGIEKLYLTGQNTDPCLYPFLMELVTFLQVDMNFKVGIRTNGYGAIGHLDTFNFCREEIGYSIMSLDYNINKKITGVYELPDWKYIIPRTNWCRASIVINRYNFIELMDMLKYLSQFDALRYIQLRRISTETRQNEMLPDVEIFEQVYQSFKANFGHQMSEPFMGAEVFKLFGKEISFWRTVKTDANSFNYYTDGVFTDEYFIIDGYLKAIGEK